MHVVFIENAAVWMFARPVIITGNSQILNRYYRFKSIQISCYTHFKKALVFKELNDLQNEKAIEEILALLDKLNVE